jgi:TPR repeat protein
METRGILRKWCVVALWLGSAGIGWAEDTEVLRKRAEQGDPSAQYLLGVRCETGDGLEQDDRLAAAWYRTAADQGQVEAQLRLGLMHNEGSGCFPKECFQEALNIASQQQAKSFELRAATSLARLWQQQGKGDQAHTNYWRVPWRCAAGTATWPQILRLAREKNASISEEKHRL